MRLKLGQIEEKIFLNTLFFVCKNIEASRIEII